MKGSKRFDLGVGVSRQSTKEWKREGEGVNYLTVVLGMPGRPIIYTGMMDCFARMIRQEGISSFYRGIVPNFMKAIPAISISYMVYEKTKMFLVSHT